MNEILFFYITRAFLTAFAITLVIASICGNVEAYAHESWGSFLKGVKYYLIIFAWGFVFFAALFALATFFVRF